MRDPITRVENYSGGAAGGVEGENSLNGCVKGGDVEGFEEDLGSSVAV